MRRGPCPCPLGDVVVVDVDVDSDAMLMIIGGFKECLGKMGFEEEEW